MTKTALTLALILGLAAPAFAGNCPVVIGEIEEALKTATLDEATMTQVTALLDTGKTAHDAGDHAASMAALDEAKVLLGV